MWDIILLYLCLGQKYYRGLSCGHSGMSQSNCCKGQWVKVKCNIVSLCIKFMGHKFNTGGYHKSKVDSIPLIKCLLSQKLTRNC